MMWCILVLIKYLFTTEHVDRSMVVEVEAPRREILHNIMDYPNELLSIKTTSYPIRCCECRNVGIILIEENRLDECDSYICLFCANGIRDYDLKKNKYLLKFNSNNNNRKDVYYYGESDAYKLSIIENCKFKLAGSFFESEDSAYECVVCPYFKNITSHEFVIDETMLPNIRISSFFFGKERIGKKRQYFEEPSNFENHQQGEHCDFSNHPNPPPCDKDMINTAVNSGNEESAVSKTFNFNSELYYSVALRDHLLDRRDLGELSGINEIEGSYVPCFRKRAKRDVCDDVENLNNGKPENLLQNFNATVSYGIDTTEKDKQSIAILSNSEVEETNGHTFEHVVEVQKLEEDGHEVLNSEREDFNIDECLRRIYKKVENSTDDLTKIIKEEARLMCSSIDIDENDTQVYDFFVDIFKLELSKNTKYKEMLYPSEVLEKDKELQNQLKNGLKVEQQKDEKVKKSCYHNKCNLNPNIPVKTIIVEFMKNQKLMFKLKIDNLNLLYEGNLRIKLFPDCENKKMGISFAVKYIDNVEVSAEKGRVCRVMRFLVIMDFGITSNLSDCMYKFVFFTLYRLYHLQENVCFNSLGLLYEEDKDGLLDEVVCNKQIEKFLKWGKWLENKDFDLKYIIEKDINGKVKKDIETIFSKLDGTQNVGDIIDIAKVIDGDVFYKRYYAFELLFAVNDNVDIKKFTDLVVTVFKSINFEKEEKKFVAIKDKKRINVYWFKYYTVVCTADEKSFRKVFEELTKFKQCSTDLFIFKVFTKCSFKSK